MAKAPKVRLLRLRDNCFDENAVLFEAQEKGSFQSKGLGDDTLPDKKEVLEILSYFGGKSLDKLRSDSILDLTPEGHLDDKERKELVFFSYEDEKKEVGGKVESFRLGTSNLMGVLRFRDAKNKVSVQVEVLSRFDKGKDNFFLNHMLSKVMDVSFGFNEVSSKRESMLDFLLDVVFVNYLARATRYGLFKQYRERRNNDWNFKGRLDLPRHLRENVPLMHGIAYVKREIEHDVPLNQMILLAAKEVRKRQPGIFDRNEDVRDAFRQLQINIPNPGTARDVLRQRTCREPVTHPYFQETYEPLRKVAKMILEGEQWSLFADNGDAEVSGVVFDGSWLWEEYVATVLAKAGFRHGTSAEPVLRVFTDKPKRFIPDFYRLNGSGEQGCDTILDAKYKRSNPRGQREDVHQVLCYLLLTGATRGGLVFPPIKNEENPRPSENGRLEDNIVEENGVGGWSDEQPIASPDGNRTWRCFSWAPIKPEDTDSWSSFCEYMQKQEVALIGGLPTP